VLHLLFANELPKSFQGLVAHVGNRVEEFPVVLMDFADGLSGFVYHCNPLFCDAGNGARGGKKAPCIFWPDGVNHPVDFTWERPPMLRLIRLSGFDSIRRRFSTAVFPAARPNEARLGFSDIFEHEVAHGAAMVEAPDVSLNAKDALGLPFSVSSMTRRAGARSPHIGEGSPAHWRRRRPCAATDAASCRLVRTGNVGNPNPSAALRYSTVIKW
jgi:hypothetical protein